MTTQQTPTEIQITIPAATIQNLFDSVVGGPYSGWIKGFDAGHNAEGQWEGKIIFDREKDEEGSFKGRVVITDGTIQKGLEAMAREFPHRFGNVLTGDTDAVDADCFMQSLVFGKEVYA